MRKQILTRIVLALVCLVMLCPLSVHAVTPLDPDAQACLTLHYQKDGVAFAGLEIEIYRVAQAFPDGTFKLITPYAFYPVNIHDITNQEQWKYIASTLSSYVVADQVAPDRQGITDGKGTVVFDHLQTGLYLVREVVGENATGIYLFDHFMIYVPTPNADGTFDYDVEAKPKGAQLVPKTQYTVTKLWQDTGSQNVRPKSVTVDIYKDGVLDRTQVLSAENNWTYTWYVSGEDPGNWTVVERTVPDGYKVTIRENGGTFTIINTRQTSPDPPKTGDTFTPLPWVLGMCLSGMALLLLGVYSRRRR